MVRPGIPRADLSVSPQKNHAVPSRQQPRPGYSPRRHLTSGRIADAPPGLKEQLIHSVAVQIGCLEPAIARQISRPARTHAPKAYGDLHGIAGRGKHFYFNAGSPLSIAARVGARRRAEQGLSADKKRVVVPPLDLPLPRPARIANVAVSVGLFQGNARPLRLTVHGTGVGRTRYHALV